MTLVSAKMPTLKLLPNLPLSFPPSQKYPAERDINRHTLLIIAPDREDLLTGEKSVEIIRQELKLRPGSSRNHWLYKARKTAEIRPRRPITRTSTFIGPHDGVGGILDENTAPDVHTMHSVRRVLSDPSVSPLGSSTFPNRLETSDTWAALPLSNSEKLVSPRCLGPTHVLIISSSSPAPPSSVFPTTPSGPSSKKAPRRPSLLTETFEVPINDLLFTLNVPNLANPTDLPHRLPSELPKVYLQVRHMKTFPELVIYLHTKNQAELFRKLIPEWIRDLMHPLPMLKAFKMNSTTSKSSPRQTGLHLLRRNNSQRGLFWSSSSENLKAEVADLSHGSGHTFDRVAQDIARAEAPSREGDQLVASIALLNALRDNLDQLGYFCAELWAELDTSKDILVKALNLRARVD